MLAVIGARLGAVWWPPCSSLFDRVIVAEMQPPKGRVKTSGQATRGKASAGFTVEERAAMRERAREVKAERGTGAGDTAGESDVLAKIAEMSEPDRSMAERIHAIVKDSAPDLSPRTWYGMPAYAKDGKVVCFFQGAQKFKTRYATFGFSDRANLDDGQHVADGVRTRDADRRRRGEDPYAREEVSELRDAATCSVRRAGRSADDYKLSPPHASS